jgi:glycosyltransferase involved in cell wall biosynthesis
LRILFINHASYVSGAENSLLHLINGLVRADYEPFAICPPDGQLPGMLRTAGVILTTLPMKKSPAAFLQTIKAITRDILRYKIDLVHANSIDAIQYSMIPARLTHTPLVGHVRNIASFRKRGVFFVKHANQLIAVSEATSRSLVEQGVPSERIRVIYNGVDTDRFAPKLMGKNESRMLFNLPADVPLVGSVGRLHPIKGYESLLQASCLIFSMMPETHFAIAGSEFDPGQKYRDDLLGFARQLGIAERVHFVGEVDQVETFLQSLDVFALPSLQEPFARAILEAMSCACPIVATAVGGTPEAIEDGRHGLLIPPACPDAMASAIMRLLGDHEYATLLGRAARERVVAQFSITSNVERTQALYRELIPAWR